MINTLFKSLFYFVLCILLQVLVLNNIHILRIATPFIYLYFVIKLPVGTSKVKVLFLSFLIGIVVDIFSNTIGMHAAACTLAGFCRQSMISFFKGGDLPDESVPSYKNFGYTSFFNYVLSFSLMHQLTLFLVESLTLFDPLFLAMRIVTSVLSTTLLICVVEAFNLESRKTSGE